MTISTERTAVETTISGDDIHAAEDAIAGVYAEIAVRQLAARGHLSDTYPPAPLRLVVDDPYGDLLTSQIVASMLAAVHQHGPGVGITVVYADSAPAGARSVPRRLCHDVVVLALLAERPRPVDQIAADEVWTGRAGWPHPPTPGQVSDALDALGLAGLVTCRDGVASPTAHAAAWAQRARECLRTPQPA